MIITMYFGMFGLRVITIVLVFVTKPFKTILSRYGSHRINVSSDLDWFGMDLVARFFLMFESKYGCKFTCQRKPRRKTGSKARWNRISPKTSRPIANGLRFCSY